MKFHEAEAAILGKIIDEPQCMGVVTERLCVSDFSPEGQKIYLAIQELVAEKGKADFTSLVKRLDGKINRELLKTIAEYGMLSTDIEEAISTVKKLSFRQKFINTLSSSLALLRNENSDALNVASQLESSLCNLLSERETTSPEIKNLIIEYENFIHQKQKPWLTLPFPCLNDTVGGLIPGHFWIIGAYTSCGKTTTVVEIATHLLKHHAVIVHFSLEEERKLTVARYLANLTGIPVLAQLKNSLDEKAKEALENAKSFLSTKRLLIYDDIFTPEEIYFKSRLAQIRNGRVDVIIIDYIQLLKIPEKRTLVEKMDIAAEMLRELAKKMHTTVIAVSQAGREYVKDSSSRVIAFKGSGALEASCDVGIWLEPAPDDREKFYLYVKKYRIGPTAAFPMKFINNFTAVTEITGENQNGEIKGLSFAQTDEEIFDEEVPF